MKLQEPGPAKDLGNLASASTRQMLVRVGPPCLLWTKPVPIADLVLSQQVLAFTIQGMPIQVLPAPHTFLGLYPNFTHH